jgi:hypothetical protein
MTFFANSGVAWPNVELITRQAGEKALQGGSRLWQFLAGLEGRSPDSRGESDERGDRITNTELLRDAAQGYRAVIDQIDGGLVAELSLAEMELANIGPYPFYYYGFPYPDFDRRGPVSVRDLYNELALRLEVLASHIISFEPQRDKRDLAPQTFLLMRQWEALATLARIIAVLNRREIGTTSPSPPRA